MPEKPKSLADEYPRIMLVVETCDEGHKYGKASGAEHGCPWCMKQGLAKARADFLAIESELNELRQLHAVDIAWDKLLNSPESIAYLEKLSADRTSVPPRVESHSTLVNGLDPRAPGQPFGSRESFRALIDRNTFEQPSGLPCSNPSDWDNEDGG